MPDRTVTAGGSITAPGAGATLASIAAGSLPAGQYRIKTICGVSGVAVADLGNIRLRRAGVDLVGGPVPCGASGGEQDFELDGVALDGTQALDLIAIGAGTAAIEYNVTLTAERTG